VMPSGHLVRRFGWLICELAVLDCLPGASVEI